VLWKCAFHISTTPKNRKYYNIHIQFSPSCQEYEMNVIILESSPNTDGLTAACSSAAQYGAQAGGGSISCIRINDLNIQQCRACDHGWGTCLPDHGCQVLDDFQAAHQRICRQMPWSSSPRYIGAR
jgi:hypothetical protein